MSRITWNEDSWKVSKPFRIALLNGFDRSGTSFVGGLLAKHPAVNYLYQPFSRTEVHLTHSEVWQRDHTATATEQFVAELLQGRIDHSYIAADYLEKYSTSPKIVTDKLNLMKETKWHFKIDWLQHKFPELRVYGIWRDPRGILCSLVRNGFHRTWYGGREFEDTADTIRQLDALSPWRPFLVQSLNDVLKMAVIVAARTHMMCQWVLPDNWLIYEDIVEDPNRGLCPLTAQEMLSDFDFAPFRHEDFNVVGHHFEQVNRWRTFFSGADLAKMEAVFSSLVTPTAVSP